MNREPLVPIVIVTYNRVSILRDAVLSAIRQDYGNIELIIYDDGSTDATEEVVKRYQARFSRKIIYLKGAHTGCLGVGRNEGFRAGRGEYFIFFDDDDLLTRDSARKRIQFMQRYPQVDWAVCRARQIKVEKSRLARYLEKKEHDRLAWFVPGCVLKPALKALSVVLRLLRLDTAKKLFNAGAQEYFEGVIKRLAGCDFQRRVVARELSVRNFLGPGIVIFRRAAFEELGGFTDKDMKGSEDYELFARAAMRFQLGFIKEILLIRRRIEGFAMSRQGHEDYVKRTRDMLISRLSE